MGACHWPAKPVPNEVEGTRPAKPPGPDVKRSNKAGGDSGGREVDVTKREVTAILVKLLGVYAIIQAIPVLQYFWPVIGLIVRQQAWLYLVGMGMPFLLMAVAAFLLLTRSERIAGFLVKEDGPVSPTMPLSGLEVQAIAFSAVGVLVFLQAVPRLCQLFMNLLWFMRSQSAKGQPPADGRAENTWQLGIAVGLQCGLAVILFLRANGLANLWHRIQGARPARSGDEPDGKKNHAA